MHGTQPRYADWKAPADDGAVLLWPQPDQLLRDTESNHGLLSSADCVRIQGVTLPELRRSLRTWIGHTDERAPLLAMGHQTELYHPGVWAKNALIDAAAAKLGGRPFQFAIDTDEPKHLNLKWPGGSAPVTDDETPAEWNGLLAAPSPAHLSRVADAFTRDAAGWDFTPLVPEFLSSLRRLALERPSLPAALTNASHALDWSLGLRLDAMLFSPLCEAEPYLLFAYHVLSRAGVFAADYNAALDEYRLEHKVRTPGRPMPNLAVTPDACEVPFWLDSLSRGTRKRASVVRRADRWVLPGPAGGELPLQPEAAAPAACRELSDWLRANDLRLAPRALTLTTVLRLLITDQFVHGIGGGRYDQVTDTLISRQFGLEPPRFAVTTATLYFPQAVGRQRVCMSCVLQEGHRLRHRVLGEEKDRLVAMIAAAPRRSLERSVLFHDMHHRLARASSHPAVRQWKQELAEAGRREQEEKDLFDRELFYAVQSRERLEGVIDQYRTRFRVG
jgi:hypothetical protein